MGERYEPVDGGISQPLSSEKSTYFKCKGWFIGYKSGECLEE